MGAGLTRARRQTGEEEALVSLTLARAETGRGDWERWRPRRSPIRVENPEEVPRSRGRAERGGGRQGQKFCIRIPHDTYVTRHQDGAMGSGGRRKNEREKERKKLWKCGGEKF